MADQCYALTVTYSVAGEFAQNVFKYKLDDSGFADSASAAKALITKFVSDKLPLILDMASTDLIALSVKARAIDTSGGFEAVTLLPPATAGTRGGFESAAALAAVIVWFPNGNAKARGKTYIPGLSEGDVAEGVYTAAYINQAATFITNFGSDMVLTGGGSPTAKFVIRQTKPTYSLLGIQYGNLAPNVGTLRKRMRPA